MDIVVNIQKHNGLNVVSSRVVAEQLGKGHKRVLQDCRKKLLEGVEFVSSSYITNQNKQATEYLLTKDGLKMLLSTYRGITKEQYQSLGIDSIDVRHTYTRFEIAFGEMLTEALAEIGLTVEKQFNVDGYRVDFYISEVNVCVEYDEEQHFGEISAKKDEERQSYIEKKLKTKFIRCDYRDSDIKNVMKVLKEVM